MALLGLPLLADWGTGGLTRWRGALRLTLSVLLFVALCPPRVRVGQGWVASRSLLHSRLVRTDLLVSVRWVGGVRRRLVLLDALGEDVRHSAAAGLLRCGAEGLRHLSERVGRETAPAVFRASGLEP
ncbi:hypothetical protein ACFYNZ_31345 [Streptomyces kebangsaanensis]|uniref:PH domain-containing protein n=1 Tax=Streptomyces kebangsaanensis TaxID=864058 RepID=A0ABW6L1B7_9ACTN